ncbi:MAG: hypothetical protein ACRD2N_18005 [Vicinamibacterales bacterium]
MRRSLLTLALALVAAPVWAQQVKIAFNDGQVSVETNGAPPRVVLAEWSKVGGTTIVNAERVAGAPLTLRLVDVPEAHALEIILRSVAGYMAAPRGKTPGASRYDRILVMPTSAPVASSAAAARPTPAGQPFGPAMGTQRFIPPRPAAQPVEEAPEVEEPEPQQEPAFTFPQPNQPGYRAAPVQPVQQPTMVSPDAPSPTPVFGVVGAPMPGMIQVPQQQQQPVTLPRPPRPPGQ